MTRLIRGSNPQNSRFWDPKVYPEPNPLNPLAQPLLSKSEHWTARSQKSQWGSKSELFRGLLCKGLGFSEPIAPVVITIITTLSVLSIP